MQCHMYKGGILWTLMDNHMYRQRQKETKQRDQKEPDYVYFAIETGVEQI